MLLVDWGWTPAKLRLSRFWARSPLFRLWFWSGGSNVRGCRVGTRWRSSLCSTPCSRWMAVAVDDECHERSSVADLVLDHGLPMINTAASRSASRPSWNRCRSTRMCCITQSCAAGSVGYIAASWLIAYGLRPVSSQPFWGAARQLQAAVGDCRVRVALVVRVVPIVEDRTPPKGQMISIVARCAGLFLLVWLNAMLVRCFDIYANPFLTDLGVPRASAVQTRGVIVEAVLLGLHAVLVRVAELTILVPRAGTGRLVHRLPRVPRVVRDLQPVVPSAWPALPGHELPLPSLVEPVCQPSRAAMARDRSERAGRDSRAGNCDWIVVQRLAGGSILCGRRP